MPGFEAFARFAFLHLDPVSDIVAGTGPDTVMLRFKSEEGGQQGDPAFPLCYAAATHAAAVEIDEDLKPHGGGARFFFDDGYIYGPKAAVFAALEKYERRRRGPTNWTGSSPLCSRTRSTSRRSSRRCGACPDCWFVVRRRRRSRLATEIVRIKTKVDAYYLDCVL